MKIRINPEIFQQFTVDRIGLVIAKNIDNTKNREQTLARLRQEEEAVNDRFDMESLSIDPRISTWRSIFAQFGADSTKHFCSIEALMKRIIGGRQIPDINPLVNIYNALSLKYILPFGGEDLDHLCGDVELAFADGSEDFVAVGQTKTKHPAKGEVIYKDAAAVTCRKWNWREAERTKFTEKSKNVVVIIEFTNEVSDEDFQGALRETEESIKKYLGGDTEVVVLDKDHPEHEFGIEGKTLEECKTERAQRGMKKKEREVKKNVYLENSLESVLNKAIVEIVQDLFGIKIESTEILIPEIAEHGDFSCNVAMHICKEIGKNPRETGEVIKGKIEGKISEIEKIDIAGPGFLNFFVKKEYVLNQFGQLFAQKEILRYKDFGKKQPVVVEYSQPNIAKPLGAHHLLSTIIGQALYNMYKTVGFKSISVNHIGDWGTQFGKIIHAYRLWGNKNLVEKDPIPELLKLYVRFHEESENNSSLLDHAREEFLKLEQGDKENKQLWKWICDVSMSDVQKVYDRLEGIHFDHTIGEAFYEDKMQSILDRGKKEGFFKEGEKGALMFFFEDESIPPMMVQRSDGATLYATRDLAQVQYRSREWNIRKNILVVDVAQELHFKQYFEIAKELGLNKTSDGYETELVHVKFGRMQFRDTSMSTRKGNIILAEDVIKEAEERAKKIIIKKESILDEAGREELAHIMAIGAIKYNILSQNRNSNIVFDWDKMLSFEGNSAPYLQYTYARSRSILRKAEERKFHYKKDISPQFEMTAKERSILLLIMRFPQVMLRAADEYYPHLICNHLYDLAQEFNSFYNSEPVLHAEDEEQRTFRLKLVDVVSRVISEGLNILGIRVPEKM